MADFGITPEGFSPKTTADTLTSIQTTQTQQIDPNLDLQPTNPLGVMNGIVAAALGEVWQLGGALYSGMDRANAADDQLTSVCLLTGTEREKPSATLVEACTVNVATGFHAEPGTMFAHIVGDATAVFANKGVVDNPTAGALNETVDFVAIVDGPQQCLAHTLMVIAQALSGWNSIDNANDGIIGANVETDTNVRLRSDNDLSAAGQSTPEAIRSSILEASQAGKFSTFVVSCVVLFNDADAVDSDGLPAHSIEVICYQPGATASDDQTLADLIATNKGGGMATWGGSTKTHTDSQGFNETIRFTRPDPLRIYVAITVSRALIYAGDLAVKQAIAADGNKIGAGGTIVAKQVQAQAFTIVGVFDVLDFKIDTVGPPIGTGNISVGLRQVPTFSTGDITVS